VNGNELCSAAPAALARLPHLAALARMTGHGTGGGQFGNLVTYLDNLQKSLLPLCIPLGTIGLAGGGVAYMLGNHMAQRILGGVVAGTALVLLAREIMA
jgi:hypothetical protein